MGDNLGKEERGKRGVKDARALIREILSVGMPEQYVDIKRNAATGLIGLDRAEAAIEEYRRGEWIAGGVVDEEARENIGEMARPAEEDCESECCEDTLVLDREGARMVLARMHVVDELPQCDAPRRSAAEIADALDSSGRDADYVEEVLGTLEGHDVADVGDDGARLAHRRVVVEPLVEGGTSEEGGHLSDTSDVDGTAMTTEEKLKARLAMFVSGSKGWISGAEEQDIDDEVIDEVEEAHAHAKKAFDLLRGEE